jgi:hypothetical protein
VLRFVGTPHNAQAGTWLGVELDEALGKVSLWGHGGAFVW